MGYRSNVAYTIRSTALAQSGSSPTDEELLQAKLSFNLFLAEAKSKLSGVFGEGDFLPGLVIDKFGDYFVMQTLTLFMDENKKMIADVISEIFSPKETDSLLIHCISWVCNSWLLG